MLSSTLAHLRCPKLKKAASVCGGELAISGKKGGAAPTEIRSGTIECGKCRARFPVLAGVAVLVDDVHGYLLAHVKGISQIVPDSEIPAEYLSDYREAKAEIETEHIEEDLEAERVTALYVMNHYLRAGAASSEPFWKSRAGSSSPLIDELVRKHWDQGPFAWIERWLRESGGGERQQAVELGCGVGGLYSVLKSRVGFYLGVDSSFASIALARHLALGAAYPRKIRVPEDLLQGAVSREVKIAPAGSLDGHADFVVGELDLPPLPDGAFDISIALNAIDMLEEPSVLPALQAKVTREGGVAIQSCPYIWHPEVSRKLRARLPREVATSARAVEWLYEKAGLKIQTREEHVPWLFFKHVRQLEIYDVHVFAARK